MSLWRLWAKPCQLVILDDQEFHIGKVILSLLLREMTGNEKSFNVFIPGPLEYAFFSSYHTCARSHSLDVIQFGAVLSRICIPFSGRALAMSDISSKKEMTLIRSRSLRTFSQGLLSPDISLLVIF